MIIVRYDTILDQSEHVHLYNHQDRIICMYNYIVVIIIIIILSLLLLLLLLPDVKAVLSSSGVVFKTYMQFCVY